jgi:signal transduction histidine kinase
VLDEMFDALLDISRLDAGVVLPRYQTFPAQQIFDRIEAEFSWTAREKGLVLTVEKCAESLSGDPLLLERILRNLIANAIRYTERGSVRVRCAAAADGMHIEVHDSGIGISEQHLPRIFEEYYQIGNSQRDRTNGLGLGLAIVQRLARLLGGDVSVSSTVGMGSCFSLLIPLKTRDDMIRSLEEHENKGEKNENLTGR